MDEVEKEKFATKEILLDVISEEKEEFITGQTQIKYEEKYDSKDEMKPTCNENIDEEVTHEESHKSTVNITVEEVEEFPINANYYIEEDTSMS